MSDNGQKHSSQHSTNTQLVPLANMHRSNIAKLTGTFLGGVAIGIILAWSWGAVRGTVASTQTPSSTVGSNTSAQNSTTTGAALSIGAQKAGDSVNVSNVKVSRPTWVVIYELNGDERGNALGAKLFFGSSVAQSGTINLLRATAVGKTYAIGQSIDNGNRVFELRADKQVTDEQGEPVWLTFKAE